MSPSLWRSHDNHRSNDDDDNVDGDDDDDNNNDDGGGDDHDDGDGYDNDVEGHDDNVDGDPTFSVTKDGIILIIISEFREYIFCYFKTSTCLNLNLFTFQFSLYSFNVCIVLSDLRCN